MGVFSANMIESDAICTHAAAHCLPRQTNNQAFTENLHSGVIIEISFTKTRIKMIYKPEVTKLLSCLAKMEMSL